MTAYGAPLGSVTAAYGSHISRHLQRSGMSTKKSRVFFSGQAMIPLETEVLAKKK